MTSRQLIVLFSIAVLLALAGCTVFQNLEGRDEMSATVYRLATWRLIDESIPRAQFVATQTQRIMEDIDAGNLATLGALKREVDYIVAKLGLTPMETMALQDLVGLFSQDLQAQAGTSVQIQQIHEIVRPRLGWVHEAATRMRAFLEKQ
jgi:hypothetical protein